MIDVLFVLSFERYLELLIVLFAGILLAWAFANRPRAAFVFWMIVLVGVPFWFVIDALSLPPATIAFAIVAPCIWINRPDTDRWLGSDTVLLGVIVVGSVAYFVLNTPKYAILAVVTQWLTAYLVGRRLAAVCGWEFVTDTIAIIGGIVGLWACIEFVADWHVFVHTGDISKKIGFWANIQERGGVARSETAFGQGIALGGFLAMTIPFALTTSRRNLRFPLLVVILAGVITTLSRGPIISAVLAIVLSLLLLSSKVLAPRVRFWGMLFTTFGAAFVGPPLLTRFASLSNELDPSTNYRENLWRLIPQDLVVIGQAHNVGTDSQGRSLYREFGSIDSTPLLVGLDFGWIVVSMLIIGIGVVAWRVFRGVGTISDIALVAQAPTLLTVALITQYGAAVWLLVGMAAAQQLRRPTPDRMLAPKAMRDEPARA